MVETARVTSNPQNFPTNLFLVRDALTYYTVETSNSGTVSNGFKHNYPPTLPFNLNLSLRSGHPIQINQTHASWKKHLMTQNVVHSPWKSFPGVTKQLLMKGMKSLPLIKGIKLKASVPELFINDMIFPALHSDPHLHTLIIHFTFLFLLDSQKYVGQAFFSEVYFLILLFHNAAFIWFTIRGYKFVISTSREILFGLLYPLTWHG